MDWGRLTPSIPRPQKQSAGSTHHRRISQIGIHTCPWCDCNPIHLVEVPHSDPLLSFFAMNVRYLLTQLPIEKGKPAVYEQTDHAIRRDAEASTFIGVVNLLESRVENPEQVMADLVEASKRITRDQLDARDDCGFGPFVSMSSSSIEAQTSRR